MLEREKVIWEERKENILKKNCEYGFVRERKKIDNEELRKKKKVSEIERGTRQGREK